LIFNVFAVIDESYGSIDDGRLTIVSGAAVLGGALYAVGGHDGWSYLSSVERYDPDTQLWTHVAAMSAPRSTLGVAVVDGRSVKLRRSTGAEYRDDRVCLPVCFCLRVCASKKVKVAHTRLPSVGFRR